MFAIIENGGKQYKVEAGSVFEIEKLPVGTGKDIVFDSVLLTADGDNIRVGAPYVEAVKVTAEALRELKAKKVISFKYRRRKSSKTTKGHRQQLTQVRIKEIKI